MFKTPPMSTEARFGAMPDCAPIQPQASPRSLWMKTLPTPKSPTHSLYSPLSFKTPTKGSHRMSINTSFDDSVFSPSQDLTSSTERDFFPSPDTSPVDTMYGPKLSMDSPISPQLASPLEKRSFPVSVTFSEEDVVHELDDSVISDSVPISLNNTALGKGAYSTVLECSSPTEKFAIKIPTNSKKSKYIYKEMFNYKIIQNYLIKNDFPLDSFPILNAHGLTFMNKKQYVKLRVGETVPCLVLPLVPSTLDKLISNSAPSNPPYQLHISSDLWWVLAKQLLMSLIVLHDCHMVHMDFKPTNILYDPITQNFKVADFTSAELAEDVAAEYKTKIDNGMFFDLTLQYCAPELIGTPPAAPSYMTDLYAIGLILLSAATGEEPYSEIIKSQNASSMIYLNESIKKNKVLDLLSNRAFAILRSNTDADMLIRMILQERCSLEQVVEFVNSI